MMGARCQQNGFWPFYNKMKSDFYRIEQLLGYAVVNTRATMQFECVYEEFTFILPFLRIFVQLVDIWLIQIYTS